jgi:alpha-tubulin suppressor-like RCC1 family protein
MYASTEIGGNQIFGCGLNNRGQLGAGFTQEKVISPVFIDSLSQEASS